MAIRSGLASQIGYKLETTVGTYAAPDRFVPLTSESLTAKRARIDSEGIVPGRQVLRSEQWAIGATEVGGDVQHELYQAGLGALLKATMGANSTTGAGPYTHALTIADLYGVALTVGVGRPDNSGTVRNYVYTGCKVASAEFAIEEGQAATAGFTFLGMDEDLGQSLASATYGTDKANPYVYKDATVEYNGGTVKVRSAKISIDNALSERRPIGQRTTLEPVQTGLRQIGVELVVEHAGFTDYNLVKNGTEVDWEVALADGTNSLTFAGHARVDGEPATVQGKDMLLQTLMLKVVADDTDAAAFTIDMVNSESAI